MAPYMAVKGPVRNLTTLTPICQRDGMWLKRDDLFKRGGASGGKARTCWALAAGEKRGLVTASSRSSPQALIVARIARDLGIEATLHMPTGQLPRALWEEVVATGGRVMPVQHRTGHSSVIKARARADAALRMWRLIPFGMECRQAVDLTAAQVANVPNGVLQRLVIPVGSGMSLAGVLEGLWRYRIRDIKGEEVPVLGVQVGAGPMDRIARWMPWLGRWSDLQLVKSEQRYSQPAPYTRLGDVELDPIYEAKCLPYLRPGDLLWVVGIR